MNALMSAAYPERCPLVLAWMPAGACTLRGQCPSANSTIHQKAGIFDTAVRNYACQQNGILAHSQSGKPLAIAGKLSTLKHLTQNR